MFLRVSRLFLLICLFNCDYRIVAAPSNAPVSFSAQGAYTSLDTLIASAQYGVVGKMVDVMPLLRAFAQQNPQLSSTDLLNCAALTQMASSSNWPDPCFGYPKQLILRTNDSRILVFYENCSIFINYSEFIQPSTNFDEFETFVLYCHTPKYSPIADENHAFFMRHGISDDPHTLTCMIYNHIGQMPEKKTSMTEHLLSLHRSNVGIDFGAWTDAIHYLDLNQRKKPFNLILLNDTVRGPFLPWFHQKYSTRPWTKYFTDMLTDQVKLAGVTINVCPYNRPIGSWAPHVQSMVLATDEVGFALGVRAHVFTVYKEKLAVIDQCEIGFSQSILAHGFNIDCLAPLLHGHDYRSPEKCPLRTGDVWYENAYFNASLHPYDVIFFKTNRGVAVKQLQAATDAKKFQ